jgi:hypothetical protein
VEQEPRGIRHVTGAELDPGVQHRGDEADGTAGSIPQLGEKRCADPPGMGQRLREDYSLIVPPALDLDVFLGEREAAAQTEVGDGSALRIDTQAIRALGPFGADPKI